MKGAGSPAPSDSDCTIGQCSPAHSAVIVEPITAESQPVNYEEA